jgi:hypothetical protein
VLEEPVFRCPFDFFVARKHTFYIEEFFAWRIVKIDIRGYTVRGEEKECRFC